MDILVQSPWPIIVGVASLIAIIGVLLLWVRPGLPPPEKALQTGSKPLAREPVIPDDDGSLSAALKPYFLWCQSKGWAHGSEPTSSDLAEAGWWFHAIYTRFAAIIGPSKVHFSSALAMWSVVASGEFVAAMASAAAGRGIKSHSRSDDAVVWSIEPGGRREFDKGPLLDEVGKAIGQQREGLQDYFAMVCPRPPKKEEEEG